MPRQTSEKSGKQQTKTIAEPLSALYHTKFNAFLDATHPEDSPTHDFFASFQDLRQHVRRLLAATTINPQLRVITCLGLPLSHCSALPQGSGGMELMVLLVSMLFDPSIPAFQRTLLNMLQTAPAHVHAAAQACFVEGLQALGSKSLKSHTEIMQSCAVLERLIEHPKPLFKPQLKDHFATLLCMASRIVSAAVAHCQYPSGSSHGCSMGTHALDDCQYALRTASHLLQKHKPQLLAFRLHAQEAELGALRALGRTTASVLHHVHYGKDIFTSAGMVLATVLTGIRGDGDAPGQEALARLFLSGCLSACAPLPTDPQSPAKPDACAPPHPRPDTPSPHGPGSPGAHAPPPPGTPTHDPASAAATPGQDPLECVLGDDAEGFAGWFSGTLHPLGQLALLKGVINVSHHGVLLGAVRPGGDAGPQQLFADGIVPLVRGCCGHAADPTLKFMAAQTLELALRQLRRCLQALPVHRAPGACGAPAGDAGSGDDDPDGGDEPTEGGGAAAPEPAGEGPGPAPGAASPWPWGLEETYGPRLAQCLSECMALVWAGADDPSQIMHQHLKPLFEDCVAGHDAALAWHRGTRPGEPDPPDALDLDRLCAQVLGFAADRRSKYQSLAVLVPRLGAARVLALAPDLVGDCLPAMTQQAHNTQVAHLLRGLLLDCHALCAAGGAGAGQPQWTDRCVQPLAVALLRGAASAGGGPARNGILTHILPGLLEAIPLFLAELLRALAAHRAPGPPGETAFLMAFVHALLRAKVTGHTAGLADCAADAAEAAAWRGHVAAALTHGAPPLRLAALELVTASIQTCALPEAEDCALVQQFLTRNIKSPYQAFRNDFYALLKKWFSRLHTASDRYRRLAAVADAEAASDPEPEDTPDAARYAATCAHVRWLTQFMHAGLVPGASLDRQLGSVTGLLLLRQAAGANAETALVPPAITECLLLALLQPWDRLRLAAFALLDHLPSPLPGLDHSGRVASVASWALGLLHNSKLRECDAGSYVWRLLNKKYNMALGWDLILCPDGSVTVGLPPGVDATAPRPEGGLDGIAGQRRHLQLVTGFAGLLVERARGCSPAAFAPLHGLLQTLRYLFADARFEVVMPAAADAAVTASLSDRQRRTRKVRTVASDAAVAADAASAAAEIAAGWREVVAVVMESVQRVMDDALKVIASDYGAADDVGEDAAGAADADGDAAGGRAVLGTDCRGHPIFADADPSNDRLLVVNCWLAVKEAALLLGAMLQCLPLVADPERALMPVAQVEAVGRLLMHVLLHTKHNGAIAKAQEGFGLVARRLLRCGIPQLVALPGAWLDLLLSDAGVRSRDAGRTLRRSAGLPYAILALLDAEDRLQPQPLLRRCMAGLLDVAERAVSGTEGPDEATPGSPAADPAAGPPAGPDPSPRPADDAASTDPDSAEAVEISRINALNVLKYIFDDTLLGPDVQPYIAPALLLCLRGFSHESWAVRNSSMMLYASLVQRAVGGARSHAHTSIVDFATRYPGLGPVFLDYLTQATREAGRRELHPCLYPILLLFSALSPDRNVFLPDAPVPAEADAPPAPAPRQVNDLIAVFRALLLGCSALRNFMGRSMAAAALVPFVPPAQTGVVLVRTLGPLLPTATDPPPGPASPPPERTAPSNNRIHGVLLQMDYLLKAGVASEAVSVPQRRELLLTAMDVLQVDGRLTCLGVYAPPVPGRFQVCALNIALFYRLCLWVITAFPDLHPPAGERQRWLAFVKALGPVARATLDTRRALRPGEFPGVGYDGMVGDATLLFLHCLHYRALSGEEGVQDTVGPVVEGLGDATTLQFLAERTPEWVGSHRSLRLGLLRRLRAMEADGVLEGGVPAEAEPHGGMPSAAPTTTPGPATSTASRSDAPQVLQLTLKLACAVYGQPAHAHHLLQDMADATATAGPGARDTPAADLVAGLWSFLVGLDGHSTNPALLHGMLVLLAVVLRAVVAQAAAEPPDSPSLGRSVARIGAMVTQYTLLLTTYSQPDSPISLRQAVQLSVSHLHVLHGAALAPVLHPSHPLEPLVSGLVVHCWRVVQLLLDDEQELIRDAAASIVPVPSAGGGVAGAADSDPGPATNEATPASDTSHAAAADGVFRGTDDHGAESLVQVERAYELAVEHLVTFLVQRQRQADPPSQCHPVVTAHLHLLLDSFGLRRAGGGAEGGAAVALHTPSAAAFGGFEKEDTNYYVEAMLGVQYSARQLQQLWRRLPRAVVLPVVQARYEVLLGDLQTVVGYLERTVPAGTAARGDPTTAPTPSPGTDGGDDDGALVGPTHAAPVYQALYGVLLGLLFSTMIVKEGATPPAAASAVHAAVTSLGRLPLHHGLRRAADQLQALTGPGAVEQEDCWDALLGVLSHI